MPGIAGRRNATGTPRTTGTTMAASGLSVSQLNSLTDVGLLTRTEILSLFRQGEKRRKRRGW